MSTKKSTKKPVKETTAKRNNIIKNAKLFFLISGLYISTAAYGQMQIYFTINEFNAGKNREDANFIYSSIGGKNYAVDKETHSIYLYWDGSAWVNFYNVGTEKIESGRTKSYYISRGDDNFNKGDAWTRGDNWKSSDYHTLINTINYYSMAISLEPNDSEIYVKRALTCGQIAIAYSAYLESLGIFDWRAAENSPVKKYFESSSIKDIEQALRINPKNITALLVRGKYRYRFLLGEEHKKGIDDFNAIIKIDPNNAEAYYYLGEYTSSDVFSYPKVNTEKLKIAVEYFNKAIQLNPRNAEFYEGLARMYFNITTGQYYDDAILWYTKAIEFDPNNANLYYSRALSYQYKGNNRSKEKADLEQALRLDAQAGLNIKHTLNDSFRKNVQERLNQLR